MSLKDTIIKIFSKNTPKVLAEGIVQSYNERKESGEENPIDNTVEEIMKVIKENKNPVMAKEILKGIIEKIGQEEMPNRVLGKASVQISKTDKIPDSIVLKAVEESDVDISDNVLDYMIQEGDFAVQDRLQLIKSVENKKVLQARIENEFKILSKLSATKTDNEVVERIEEIKSMVEENGSNIDLRPYIQQVISKKMAENFYSDTKKGTKIYTFSRVMPEEKMIEFDLPSSVEEEYEKLEAKSPNKKNRFEKSKFKAQILSEMAKKIAYTYKKNGKFVVPQSENMQNITMDEEAIFMDTIKSIIGEQLTDMEIIRIKNQIHGIRTQKPTKEEKFREDIRIDNLHKKDEGTSILLESFKDPKTLGTYKMLIEGNIIEKLNEMPNEVKEKTIQTISEALDRGIYNDTKNQTKVEKRNFEDVEQGEENR